MSKRNRILVPIASVVVLASTSLLIWARLETRPSLGEISGMAASGRLDEAERQLGLLLKGDPKNAGANFLAAQVAMARSESMTNSGLGSDPKPAEKALEHLRRIESPNPGLGSQARLWRGKAERYLGLLDEAEASWLEALRLDPTVPEAGWLLLQEYYLQLRPDEARTLALRLHADEPDPRDRINFLVEPLRQEVMPPDAGSLVIWFDPIVKRQPTGFRANLALGKALVRSSELDRGVALLRKLAEAHPARPEAWDALLAGLDEMGEVEEMSRIVDSLPEAMSSLPWCFKFKAKLAEGRGDWRESSGYYRRAIEASPHDPQLGYRLARILRRLDERAEADRLDARHRELEALGKEALEFYQASLANLPPGAPPPPALFETIAGLRERMGHPEEAEAWRRLKGTSSSPR